MNTERRHNFRWIWITALVVAIAVALLVWALDRVTFQGERVLYSVTCTGGAWQQGVCTGKMHAADRYAFRASLRRQEVIAWVIGSTARSHTYTQCEVKSRDRWACAASAPEAPNARLQMAKGRTRCDAESAQPVHVVAKWKWYLLRTGVPLLSHAPTIAHVTCGAAR